MEPLALAYSPQGMIIAPNILGTGYLAGCGMTIGAVFGRIAGEEAGQACPWLKLAAS